MVHAVKKYFRAIAATVLMSPTLGAQGPDVTSDHFGPNEDVNPSFAWEQHAQCTLSDDVGVVLRSNWQTRHWIKLSGTQVEFNGKTEMSDAGWYQTFEGSTFTVTLSLQRVLSEPRGSDGVRLRGQIVVSRSERNMQYQVTGSCGA
jgi:hypothetical protein